MGVGVGLGIGVAVGIGVVSGVGVTPGFGFTTATPLFQTSFLPLFTHVYFFPLKVDVAPALEHFVPGVTAAADN